MPSGRTHDRITLWSLPLVVGVTYVQTQNEYLSVLVGTSFLFGGLMFGPDLDIYSNQFCRWGWLRWIWIPYQKSLRHRSFMSHGPLIGTAVRLVYLLTWVAVFSGIALLLTRSIWPAQLTLLQSIQLILRSLHNYDTQWIAIYCGLELGAMSHYLMDWSEAMYKRIQIEGLSALVTPAKPKKRQRSAKKSQISEGLTHPDPLAESLSAANVSSPQLLLPSDAAEVVSSRGSLSVAPLKEAPLKEAPLKEDESSQDPPKTPSSSEINVSGLIQSSEVQH
ncbi:MAG: metal-binding protein [Oscillatoriales cyanobacterium RM2_1_1]|nr:metal-binding protein [Oscillatoriales cyanobacterium SM2_3_0]NJO47413.1 metal-binding protein [Oscillatoriales cyanobacterium RM2_1_1]